MRQKLVDSEVQIFLAHHRDQVRKELAESTVPAELSGID
jgi:hypothetical protein